MYHYFSGSVRIPMLPMYHSKVKVNSSLLDDFAECLCTPDLLSSAGEEKRNGAVEVGTPTLIVIRGLIVRRGEWRSGSNSWKSWRE